MGLALTYSAGTLSQDIRNAIQGAIDDLPTTVAMFVAWQIVSATPVGWLANGLLAAYTAYTAYSVGSDALRVMRDLGRWVAQVSDATNRNQLCAAATSLGSLLNQFAIVAAQMINPGRVAGGLRRASGDLSHHATPDQARSPRALTRLPLLRTRGLTTSLAGSGTTGSQIEQMAADRVRNVMSQSAALHEPDMFAGGFNNPAPTCMGLRCVNSSIGAQWRNIIGELDDYSRNAQGAGHGGARMQLQLRVCNRSGV